MAAPAPKQPPSFLGKYPLVKVVVLNVLAVLTYDTLRRAPARAALLGAAHTVVTVPAMGLQAATAEPELQLALLVL